MHLLIRCLVILRLVTLGIIVSYSIDLRAQTLLSAQTFVGPGIWSNVTVPGTANRIVLKAWGPGGGGGTNTYGGGGAFVTATFKIFQQGPYMFTLQFLQVDNGGKSGANGGAGGSSGGGNGTGGGGEGGGQVFITTSSYSPINPQATITLYCAGGGGGGTGANQHGGAGQGSGATGVYGMGGSTTGGAGGSSHFSLSPDASSALISFEKISASGATPPNVNDLVYPGGNVGYGGLADNGGPGALVMLAYLVPPAPSITSALSRAHYQTQAVSYSITATNTPTSYGATGLPPGLSVNTSSGVITGTVTTNGNYNSTISATNSSGIGQATLVWNISTDSNAPSVPTGLSASLLSSTSHRLTWAASTDNFGVSEYEVKRDSTSLGTTAVTTIDVTGLTSGNTYLMTVRAKDGAGNWSSWSSSLSIQQTTLNPPSAPGGLNYADRTDTSITLIWNAALGTLPVVSYKIYRGGTEVATTSDVVFTDTGLPANTSQTYTVKAVDSAGNLSAASSSLVVSTTQNTTADSDQDGVPNVMETVLGTNPNAAGTNDNSNQAQLKINSPPK